MEGNNQTYNNELAEELVTPESLNIENENAYNEAMEKLRSYGLQWTFRSIDYILNTENMNFGQLRSCVYQSGGQLILNYIRSTMLLIKAGLIGSKQMTAANPEALTNRAFDIMEDWRNSGFYTGTLHILIIKEMEDKHFFMGNQDLKIVKHLSSSDSMKSMAQNMILCSNEEKINQVSALS